MWTVRRVGFSDAPGLAALVGDVDEFTNRVLFRAPLLARTDASLPGAEDLWDDFLRGGARQPGFRLVQAGDTTGRPGVTRSVGMGNRTIGDLIDANAVLDRYQRGDTVVLQALHHTNRDLARLVTNLSLDLDHPTQVNAYLSPPAQQGLDVHFDYHDVIVVQLTGSKHWKVWGPIERSRQPVRSVGKVAPPRLDELSEPLIDAVLRPGDVLYLPRGVPHAATTTDEASDHLTIGITALTEYRWYQELLDRGVRSGHFGASLAARGLDHDVPLPVGADLSTVPYTERDYREWRARSVWRRMPQTRLRPRQLIGTDGVVADHVRDLVLDPTLEYEFQPGPLLWATVEGTHAKLGMGSQVLSLPSEAQPLLDEMLTAPRSLRPVELSSIDADSIAAVMRRLVAEGVIAPVLAS